MNKSIKYLLGFLTLLSFCVLNGYAQDTGVPDTSEEDKTIVLPTLFDYPVAPEDLDWTARSEWLGTHFWDSFDFKKTSVGQQQLNHAFNTWIVPLSYSDANVAYKAVDDVIKKLDKNPTLLIQFTKAAEYGLYAPATAPVWMDGIFLKFLDAVEKNKKVPQTYKTRYGHERKLLNNTQVGAPATPFMYTSREGRKEKFAPRGKFSLVEFGDPECPDCQMTRISLKNNADVNRYKDAGYLDIYFFITDADENDLSWTEEVMDYPDSWIVGASEDAEDNLDIRLVPSLFLYDSEGNLVMKNVRLSDVYAKLAELIEPLMVIPVSE